MKVGKLPDFGKYQDFIFPGLVIFLIVLSAMIILKPKINDFWLLRRGLLGQKEKLAQLSQKVAVLEGYDRNELLIRTGQVLKVLPAEKDAPLVLATIRSLVNDYHLELGSLNISVGEISTESAKTVTKEKLLPSLDSQLSVSGNLSDFYDFLDALEKITPLVRINQVSITKEGTSVESKIQFSSYYLVPPKGIGKTNRQVISITSEEEKVYQELSQYQSTSVGTSLPSVGSGKENPFVF